MGIATTATLAKRVGLPNPPSYAGRTWRFGLAAALLVDFVTWCFVGGVYVVVTGLAANVIMVTGPIPLVDSASMKQFVFLCLGVAVVIVVDLYEVVTCNEAAASATIPLHTAVESIGFVVFIVLSRFISTSNGKATSPIQFPSISGSGTTTGPRFRKSKLSNQHVAVNRKMPESLAKRFS
jgi:hypothetical protein